jgi:methylglutaconyl-CoA hydratase
MAEPMIQLIVSNGVATVTLNRPDVHNALNADLTNQLLDTFLRLDRNQSVRVVVLTANGDSFCAGADLNWMKTVSTNQQTNDNLVGLQLATLMHTLYHMTKPTIVLVNGAVYGGGIGLVACCDIALVSWNTHFCFSEVRLGLIPAVISPYIVNAIGARAARRYLLTAEHISAQRAFDMGLVHDVLEDNQLQHYAIELCQKLIAAGPCSLART